MTDVEGRRKTIFGTEGMKMLDISRRPNKPFRQGPSVPNGDDMLPWVEQYTEGDFYLSNFSIGFASDYDLMMFNLAFKNEN